MQTWFIQCWACERCMIRAEIRWRQAPIWPIAASVSSLWLRSKYYELCLLPLCCSDESSGDNQVKPVDVLYKRLSQLGNLSASSQAWWARSSAEFLVKTSFSCPRRTGATWDNQKGGVVGPLQPDSPETRPLAGSSSTSFVCGRAHPLADRKGSGTESVFRLCRRPRRAAWQSMLHNEPKGHTGSFVRRRVSRTTYVIVGIIFHTESFSLKNGVY